MKRLTTRQWLYRSQIVAVVVGTIGWYLFTPPPTIFSLVGIRVFAISFLLVEAVVLALSVTRSNYP